jgi:RNA polymerase sigma-70 factor (ECF subfamily)
MDENERNPERASGLEAPRMIADASGGLADAGIDPGVSWMLAYQAGDERAFDRLVEHYSGRVWALLTRFLGPVSFREDLVQEVFLRVIRARERYEPTARFSTWLHRIAFNVCVNEQERRRERGPRPAAADDDAGGVDPQDARGLEPPAELERNDTVEAVRRAIAELPERQRMALVLARYEGLSYEEIGAVLGSSEKAVKSMVHRARESLRERLAPFLREEAAG